MRTGVLDGSVCVRWFGDANGHDTSSGISYTQVENEFVANNIMVVAVNVRHVNALGAQATSLVLATAAQGSTSVVFSPGSGTSLSELIRATVFDQLVQKEKLYLVSHGCGISELQLEILPADASPGIETNSGSERCYHPRLHVAPIPCDISVRQWQMHACARFGGCASRLIVSLALSVSLALQATCHYDLFKDGTPAELLASFTVTVNAVGDPAVRTLAPVLSPTPLPADDTFQCPHTLQPAEVLTAKDQCDHPVPVDFTEATTPGACAAESTTTRTWKAVDPLKPTLSTTHTQTLHIVDLVGPTLTPKPIGAKSCLWPPNHKYVTYALSDFFTAEDGCGGAISISLASCTSSQSDNALGDGTCGHRRAVAEQAAPTVGEH
jgi:hypothetical protein